MRGKSLDGRNRYKAAKEVGYKFTEADFREFVGTLEQAEAYVWSANYSRRNLTTAQKQAIIRQQIEKYPTWSNRKIARHLCLSSHATVAAVRDASNPALKRLTQTTPSGMAHWSGTGPPGTVCGQCSFYGYGMQHPNSCYRYFVEASEHGAALPAETPSCQHFAPRWPGRNEILRR
jgi:hypothetical protein